MVKAMKEQVKKFKAKVKAKHKTLARFALHIGVTDKELRKLLQRIAKNNGIYITAFNGQVELEKLKEKL